MTHLQQILSASENLADYIRKSGDRASAVLIRAQARKILGHAEEHAHAIADLGRLGIPIVADPRTRTGKKQQNLDEQFTLSLT